MQKKNQYWLKDHNKQDKGDLLRANDQQKA